MAAKGAPIIDDTLAFIDARVVAEYPGGDHVIFIGQVEALGTADQAAFADEDDREYSTVAEYGSNGTEKVPLAYYLGQYRHLANDYHKLSLAPQATYIHKDV